MEDPLKLCADLNAILRPQSGGWLDRDTLGRVRDLCRAVAEAAGDLQCRLELGTVEHCATELHSHRDRRVDVLREQVLVSLERVEHRARMSRAPA